MRRVLATPGVVFFLIGEACCGAIMFFRWLGGVGGKRVSIGWKHPYL